MGLIPTNLAGNGGAGTTLDAMANLIRWTSPQEGAAISVEFQHFRDPSGIYSINTAVAFDTFVLQHTKLSGCLTFTLDSSGLTLCPDFPVNVHTIGLIYLLAELKTIPSTCTTLQVYSSGVSNLPNIPVGLTAITVVECALTTAAVDSILLRLVNNAQPNGNVNLSANGAPPSAAGEASAATLVARNWTVTVDG